MADTMKINELIAVLRHCGKPGSDCHNCKMYQYSASCLRELCNEAADAMESQQNRITELEKQLRWIPIEENPPEPYQEVLVTVKEKYDFEREYGRHADVANVVEAGGYIDGHFDTFNDWDEGQQFLHVTHWKPMPELPEEVV